MPKSDEGLTGLVPNEELPATNCQHSAPAAVPVLYYTTSGGRAGAEVVIVTDSIGAQRVLSPQSGRPEDFNPKRSPVTPERLSRLRCLTILSLLLAPPVGLLVLLAFLQCRSAFQLGGSSDMTCRWARRVEWLFVVALLFSVAELVVVLLVLQYYLHFA